MKKTIAAIGPSLFTTVIFLACYWVWNAADWLVASLRLQPLDLLVHVCLVFLFLSLADAVCTRLLFRKITDQDRQS